MHVRPLRIAGWLLAALLILLAVAPPARATIALGLPVVTGSQETAQLGVTSMPTINNGTATFSHNNFTGNNDILLSPGQGYPAANFGNSTIVASAGQSSSSIVISAGSTPVANPSGTSFGGGGLATSPTGFGFMLNDTNPAGTASYALASSITTFAVPTQFFTPTIGAYFGVFGNVPAVGSFAEIGLVMTVTDTNASSPLFGTQTFSILLGDQATTSGYNQLAVGQFTSFTQTGSTFQAAASMIFGTNLPPGDTFTVASTMTVYADPAMFEVIDISNFPGLTLPAFATDAGMASVPEPSSFVMLGAGLLALFGFTVARRFRGAKAV
jgi:PEP-CTERM motif